MRLLVVVAVLNLTVIHYAIASDTAAVPCDRRSISLFASMGALEIVSLGVNIQFSDRYSMGLVASRIALGGHSEMFWNNAPGVGIRGSYYFSRSGEDSFLWANVMTADVQYLFLQRDAYKLGLRDPGGIGFEAVVGRDGIIGSGIGILWGVGVGASFHSEEPPLVFPAFRLGLHIDI